MRRKMRAFSFPEPWKVRLVEVDRDVEGVTVANSAVLENCLAMLAEGRKRKGARLGQRAPDGWTTVPGARPAPRGANGDSS